jgi:hypothetical protein
MSAAPLTFQAFETAKDRLVKALTAHSQAAQAAAEAKRNLETEQAKAMVDGIPSEAEGRNLSYAELGKNKEEREAAFPLRFKEHWPKVVEAHRKAEDELTQAKLELELARLDWDALRYQLRLLEATVGSAAGAMKEGAGQ